jgi:uncharacterized membrane protein
MEEIFKQFAGAVALGVEGAAALLIAAGAVLAIYRAAFSVRASLTQKREIWIHFAAWLLLGLEFELAADIIRTAISPGWTEIGQLGAIAVIRTFLNYFLEKDIDKYTATRRPEQPSAAIKRAA